MNPHTVDLQPGERLLWEGRPVRHRLFQLGDLVNIPFGLIFIAGASAWLTADRWRGDEPWEARPTVITLGGVVFLLVGLHTAFGRLILRAVESRRTRYAITDRRLVVVGGLSGRSITTHYLAHLLPPVLKERPDGSGSLAFGKFPGIQATSGIRWGRARSSSEPEDRPVLWDIPDVRRVRDLVAAAQSPGSSGR